MNVILSAMCLTHINCLGVIAAVVADGLVIKKVRERLAARWPWR
jgi:hypothetical protein